MAADNLPSTFAAFFHPKMKKNSPAEHVKKLAKTGSIHDIWYTRNALVETFRVWFRSFGGAKSKKTYPFTCEAWTFLSPP